MAAWTLVPCLVTLRDEFNRLAPNRDKASDGSVGDTSHGANPSDHNPDETGRTPSEDADSKNEVHAIDTDHNLRKPGWSMERCVEIIVTRHRSGADDRLQNVLYNRRIWSRSWGWTARPYTGSNAHTEHAHFSARYTSAQEADTSPWGLLEEDDDVSEQDVTTALTKFFARGVQPDNGGITSRIGRDALDQGIPNGVTGDKSPAWVAVRDLGTQVMQIKALLTALTGKDFTDEAAIVAGVLEGLDPAAIAAAIPAELAERVAQELADRLAS